MEPVWKSYISANSDDDDDDDDDDDGVFPSFQDVFVVLIFSLGPNLQMRLPPRHRCRDSNTPCFAQCDANIPP